MKAEKLERKQKHASAFHDSAYIMCANIPMAKSMAGPRTRVGNKLIVNKAKGINTGGPLIGVINTINHPSQRIELASDSVDFLNYC